jgi:hypothetical protein
MMNERTACWHGLRDELRKARAATQIDARAFHCEQAGDYADRLTQIDVPDEIEHYGSAEYLAEALTDIGWDVPWSIPL